MATWKTTNGKPVRRMDIIRPAVMVLLLGACSSPTVDTYRATPEADSPAAGVCATFAGETIRVEIFDWTDGVPQPRCIAVRPDQKLVLINQSPEQITFRLGRFHGAIESGESTILDLPFGEFLDRGVHSLHITPHGGPEIFLQ
ncbi:MAG: hypothetical protein ACK2UB_15120 [Anaerolineales bacterium]|jgi:hypothetical protein